LTAPPEQPHVPRRLVIIGGGIGGTTVAKRLANDPAFEITLLDRQNHYQFQPLLYQVATAALGSPDIATPIRFMLRHAKNVRVLQAEVTGIDVEEHRVSTSIGDVGYDVLLVAAGVEASYFGRPEWERHAPPLKTLADATQIRERVLESYEYAEAIENPAEHARQLTFVVVGGGPTGVELAGALAELAHDALAHDFRRINPRDARVILVEAGSRLVPMFDPRLSESAKQELRQRGVEVRLNAKVTDITERGVFLGEEFVPTANIIWAAGVRSSPLSQQLLAECDSIGRVRVAADCSLPDHPEVFVIGDQAHYRPPGKADALPAVGGVALQQGNHVARLLQRESKGLSRTPFRYFDRGQMATVTRHHAIVEVRKFRWSGVIAWWMWLAVHVVFLAGFRNRLTVVGHWAWTYLTLQRGSRLIVRSGRNLQKAVI
jgi:NADH:ubiquinone reductase (H+-translocating)